MMTKRHRRKQKAAEMKLLFCRGIQKSEFLEHPLILMVPQVFVWLTTILNALQLDNPDYNDNDLSFYGLLGLNGILPLYFAYLFVTLSPQTQRQR